MNIRRIVEFLPSTLSTVVQTVVIGFVAGVLSWALIRATEVYIATPFVCNTMHYCEAVPTASLISGIAIAHFVALVALIRSGVTRPLLVVIASLLALWGFQVWIASEPWWIASLYAGAMYGMAYGFFAWVNRLVMFPTALFVTTVAVVLVRFALTA